jgi:hypothetical protein
MMILLAQAVGGGFLDSMTANMIATGNGYEAKSFQLGLGLFAVLSLAGGSLYFFRYQSINGTLHGCGQGLFAMAKGIAIPLTIMLGVAAALPQLLGIAEQLGGDITGVTIQGPSEVFGTGFQLCLNLVKQPIAAFLSATHGMVANTGLAGMIPGVQATANAAALAGNAGHMATALLSTVLAVLISVFVVLPCFALITLEYVVAIANIVIVIAVGAVQMGWSAAEGTSGMASQYYASIQGAIFRLIVIIVVVGFIGATVAQWGVFLATNDISKLVGDWLQVAAGAIICAGLALKLPSLAQHVFSGQPAMTHADAVGIAKSAASAATKTVGGPKK